MVNQFRHYPVKLDGEWLNEHPKELDPTDPRDYDAPGCVGNLDNWNEVEVKPR